MIKNDNRRYVELDSLRGLAALAVFFSHAVNMLNISNGFFNLIDHSVLHIFWDGTAAVVLFFVLSGFVLTLPYVGTSDKEVDYIPFMIKRVFRIYPAYIFALFFSIVIKIFLYNRAGLAEFSQFVRQFWGWELGDLTLQSVIKHMMMIGPRFEMGEIDPIIWSLVVEMKVSVLFPFIILFIKELRSIKTGVMLLAGSYAVFKLADKGLLARMPFLDENVMFYLFMFIFGALLAKFRIRIIEAIRKIPPVISCVIFAAGIILYTSRFSLYDLGLTYSNYSYVTSFGVAIILSYIIAIPERFIVLTKKPFKFLGDISYSMYLLHFPILMVCTSILYPATGSIKLSYAVSLALSAVISYLVYCWVEVPFQKAGRSLAKIAEGALNSLKSKTTAIFKLDNKINVPFE